MGSITPTNEYEEVAQTFFNSLNTEDARPVRGADSENPQVYTYDWVSQAVSSLEEMSQNLLVFSQAVVTGMNFAMTRFVNFVSKNLDPGHIRRTVMYYRRYARHGKGKK
jgi:hypothetical protein